MAEQALLLVRPCDGCGSGLYAPFLSALMELREWLGRMKRAMTSCKRLGHELVTGRSRLETQTRGSFYLYSYLGDVLVYESIDKTALVEPEENP